MVYVYIVEERLNTFEYGWLCHLHGVFAKEELAEKYLIDFLATLTDVERAERKDSFIISLCSIETGVDK